MKAGIRLVTVAVACLAAGILFDHYQLVPYRLVRSFIVASPRPEPPLKISAAALANLQVRQDFFRRAEGSADVVMLGDSLTEMGGDWNELLSGLTVKNRGIQWDTSAGVLQRLDEVLARKPKAVVLMIGINDIRFGDDVDSIGRRIFAILERVEAAGAIPIMQSVLFTAATLGEPATNSAVRKLNDTVAAWCGNKKIAFANLNAALAPSGSLDANLTFDGIHLNWAGYLKWRDALVPILMQSLSTGRQTRG